MLNIQIEPILGQAEIALLVLRMSNTIHGKKQFNIASQESYLEAMNSLIQEMGNSVVEPLALDNPNSMPKYKFRVKGTNTFW